jgi:hypothetical protein
MDKKFRLNPNTILMLCIFGVAVLVNLIMVLVNINGLDATDEPVYRRSVLLLSALDFLKILILLVQGYLIFLIARKVIQRESWNDRYYKTIKRIGWFGVLGLLIGAISDSGHELIDSGSTTVFQMLSGPENYPGILAQAIFASPMSWLLVVAIFLLADVLLFIQSGPKSPDPIRNVD